MDVLEQRFAEKILVRCIPHDRWDHIFACALTCTPTTLSHNELRLPCATSRPNDYRLQYTNFGNRRDELCHRFLVKLITRLSWIWSNVIDRDFTQKTVTICNLFVDYSACRTFQNRVWHSRPICFVASCRTIRCGSITKKQIRWP